MKPTLEALRARYLDELLGLIAEVVAQETPAGSSIAGMTEYHMRTGGKRLRALLPLVVAELFGEDPAKLIPFGAACELLHNATLVHDDLQDGDRVRRGEPTVWVAYGEARAINLGDAMLYLTLSLCDRLDMDVAQRHRATQRVIRETLRVIDGQEREFLLKDIPSPDMDTYITMVEGKTSGLFALPLVGAAELCGAEQEVLDALQLAARHLGVVFQVQDDILDLYADKGRDQRGSDLGEGKISALVVHALQHASAEDAAWLRALLDAPREDLTPGDVARADALFREVGALDAAFAMIDDRIHAALSQPALDARPALRDLLAGMADVFLGPIQSVRHG